MPKQDYNAYLLSSHWKNVKVAMYAKFSFCQVCSSIKQLNIHHLDYSILNKELEGNNLDKLVVLCECCHKKAHTTNIHKINTRKKFIQKMEKRFLSKKEASTQKLTSKKKTLGKNPTPVNFSWLD